MGQRPLQITPSKKINIFYIGMSLGECKLKQWDICIHLLEGQKSKTLITPNVAEDVEQQWL